MNEMMKNRDADIDARLTHFFRAHLPDPWPDCQALVQLERRPERSWFRSAGRFVLAASLLLFFLGYLALAGMFPRPTTPTGIDGPTIGSKPGVHQKLPHPKP